MAGVGLMCALPLARAQAVEIPECLSDWPQTGTTLRDFEISGARDTEIVDGRVSQAGPPYWRGPDLVSPHRLFRSNVCFVGRVEAVERRCIADVQGIQSLAYIQFEVQRPYWGVTTESVVIATPVSGLENCMDYKQPRFEDFARGEYFLVLGLSRSHQYIWHSAGILRLAGNVLSNPYGETDSWARLRPLLKELGERHRFAWQFDQADLAVVVRTGGNPELLGPQQAWIRVEDVHKGEWTSDEIMVVSLDRRWGGSGEGTYEERALAYEFDFRLRPNGRYLLFLRVEDCGALRCLWGGRSQFEIRDGCVYGAQGICRGSLAEIVAGFPSPPAPVAPEGSGR
ncbi:MAG: hypothetical protein GY838_05020 [bacterium]|nr:hypothetical protein [bacterium]